MSKLPAFTEVGGYPITYIGYDGRELCAECAASSENEGSTKPFVHWEGPDSYCDECNAVLESAYGDPEEQEG